MAEYYCYHLGDGSASSSTSDPTLAANWTAAYTSLRDVLTFNTLAADDIIYLAHDHAPSTFGTAVALSFPNASRAVKVMCVNRTTGAITTGAAEATSSSFYSITGFYHIQGMTIQAGTSTGSSNLVLNSGNSSKHQGTLEDCTLYVGSTNAASGIIISSAGTAINPSSVRIVNTQVRFSNASQGIDIQHGRAWMSGLKVHASSTTPNRLFRNIGPSTLHVSSSDLSGAAAVWDRGADDGGNYARINNCKVPNAFFTGTQAVGGSNFVEYEACTNANNNYTAGRACPEGEISVSTDIYYSGNPPVGRNNDGTVYNWSYVLTPNANTDVSTPLYTPWFNIFNGTTGSMTITSYFAYDNATSLKNITAWMEVEAMGDAAAASTPMTWLRSNFPSASGVYRDLRNTGTNYSNTNATWAGTSGWSNKKTGTANVGFTINQQGYVRARFCLASPSHTVYWSPKFVIT